MQFRVYYIDDPKHRVAIDANTKEMAAWQFVAREPRKDQSQLTVESESIQGSTELTHYRACDLAGTEPPPDFPEPQLFFRVQGGPEVGYVISGTRDSLRALGNNLLRMLEKPRGEVDSEDIYSLPITPASALHREEYLLFEIATAFKITQNIRRQRLFRAIRFILWLIALFFIFIGVWTVFYPLFWP